MKETNNPYLSIVIYSRNDNYEGNAFERLQMTIDNLVLQSKKYNLSAELIIVDWNPPEDKPLLKDALLIPKDLGPMTIRFIVVPKEIHDEYRAHSKMNIIPVTALNIGIYRARGQFVWATNADLLFSNELIEFLASKKMDKEHFYRVFRYSVDENVLSKKTLDERIDFCKNNIVEVFQKNTTSIHGLKEHPILQTSCGGDFIVFSKEYWEKINGYPELNNLGAFTDWLLCYMLYLSGLKEKMLPDTMRVYHMDHKKHKQQREQFKKSTTNYVRYEIYHKLGEKSILKKILKFANNLKNRLQGILMGGFYIFIVPISKKFGPQGNWDLNTEYSYWGFHRTLIAMLKNKRSYAFNNRDWGLPNSNFKEFIV